MNIKKIYAFFRNIDLAQKANFIIKDMVIRSSFNEQEIQNFSFNMEYNTKVECCIFIIAETYEENESIVIDLLYKYGADEVINLFL